jgi:hypothetical protein
MTASDTSAAPSPTSAPDRSVPQELVDLALLAIKRGATNVALVHESLGYDFHAPIGWLLWITRGDAELVPENELRVELITHQVGCDFDPTPAWLCAPDVPEQTVIPELIDLFEVGIKNGWSVVYERKEADHHFFSRVFNERGLPLTLGMRHSLRATAHNWAYDEAARERGDQLSVEASLSLREGEIRDLVAFANDNDDHRQVDQAHVESLIRKAAPFFVPVAYHDADAEEWVI